MKNKCKINPTENQIKIMKEYWQRFQSVQDFYYRSINELEKEMSKKTSIEELEFFFCDGERVGIGNASRTMKLIHQQKLEE